jgi:hypothetical protein
MVGEELYHGWLIQITQKQDDFFFQCWMSAGTIGVADSYPYTTLEQALSAARLRADLESVRLALTSFLNSKLHRLLLNTDERNALEQSITQYIDSTKYQIG